MVITAAQNAGALGAGWRKEKDEYCLLGSPGCCGELDETWLRPPESKAEHSDPNTVPSSLRLFSPLLLI